jgi:hypothetical protein
MTRQVDRHAKVTLRRKEAASLDERRLQERILRHAGEDDERRRRLYGNRTLKRELDAVGRRLRRHRVLRGGLGCAYPCADEVRPCNDCRRDETRYLFHVFHSSLHRLLMLLLRRETGNSGDIELDFQNFKNDLAFQQLKRNLILLHPFL